MTTINEENPLVEGVNSKQGSTKDGGKSLRGLVQKNKKGNVKLDTGSEKCVEKTI